MKKILIFIISLFISFALVNEVYASNIDYDNLFDAGQIVFNNSTQKYYSNQKIELSKDNEYTMVVSQNFFGTATNIEGNFFKTNCIDKTGKTVNLGFKFSKEKSIGVYYASYSPDVDCCFNATDLLIKDLKLSELNLDGIILYDGSLTDFQGFKRYVDLNGYSRLDTTYNIYTSVDNLISLDTISSHLRAYDSNDGEINDISLVSSEYNAQRVIGTFEVIYSVKDSSGNETILSVNVTVEDKVKPVFTGPDTLIWHCYDPWPSDEEIIKHYTAVDNLDGDVSHKIFMSSSEKTGYIIGATKKYIFNLGVLDSAGNEQRFVGWIQAKDIKGPKLICEDIDCGLSTLYSDGIDGVLNKVVVECSDEAEVSNIEYVSQEFVDNNGFSGKYLVTVTATDSSGNTTVEEAYINIIDDIAPEFYIKTDLITTTVAISYSIEDIKDIIKNSLEEDGILYDDVNLISSNYFGNEKASGLYEVKYMYKYNDTTNYMVGMITVEETPTPTYYYWLIGIGVVAVISIVVVIFNKRRSMI